MELIDEKNDAVRLFDFKVNEKYIKAPNFHFDNDTILITQILQSKQSAELQKKLLHLEQLLKKSRKTK